MKFLTIVISITKVMPVKDLPYNRNEVIATQKMPVPGNRDDVPRAEELAHVDRVLDHVPVLRHVVRKPANTYLRSTHTWRILNLSLEIVL